MMHAWLIACSLPGRNVGTVQNPLIFRPAPRVYSSLYRVGAAEEVLRVWSKRWAACVRELEMPFWKILRDVMGFWTVWTR
jgi:hypothetical protein